MLTYAEVHLYYTLPVTFAVWLLAAAFLSRKDKLKIYFLVAIAFLYASPWDNYIVYHKAWWYPPERVLAVIGYVPIEEYAFFVIMTAMSSFFCILCMRWSLTSLYLTETSKTKALLIQWVPIVAFLALAGLGWVKAIPGQKTFYLGCIAWWALPVCAFIWYGAGNYIWRRKVSVLISIVVPSVYLCIVDLIALRDGVWHINEVTSLEILFFKDLPLEEIVFFFVVDVVIVFGLCAFDKSLAVQETYPELFSVVCAKTSSTQLLKNQVKAFLIQPYELSHQVKEDLQVCLSILGEASKSFNTASLVFSSGIRNDLAILYAFCRVTDDMADNTISVDERREKISVIKEFVDRIFSDRKLTKDSWKYDVGKEIDPLSTPKVDWKKLKNVLTTEQLSSFRAISRISYYLPPEPFYELIRGYNWDLEQKVVHTEADLLEYSSYVASSVATLCVSIMCAKSQLKHRILTSEDNWLIERAREMGLVLQIVNISRDIVTDSETLGRCYIPSTYLEEPEKELEILTSARKPWSIGESQLKQYAIRMLNCAAKLSASALRGISYLPDEVQGAVLAATQVYSAIGSKIASAPKYDRRARLNKTERLWIAIMCMLFKFLYVSKHKLAKLD